MIKKQKPSGFFGTNLASYLTLLGCDSVIIVGTTTSGCVRATVVDAFSLNYRVILAEEGCFDRSEASHAVSLCDMHAKYADVVSTAEILSYFDRLPADLFDLPHRLSQARNARQGGGRIASHPTRLLCCGRSLWLRIEFAQARQDLLRKERDIGDGVFVVQEAALAEH